MNQIGRLSMLALSEEREAGEKGKRERNESSVVDCASVFWEGFIQVEGEKG